MRSCPPEKKKGGYLSRPPEEKEAAKEDGEECDAIALHENLCLLFPGYRTTQLLSEVAAGMAVKSQQKGCRNTR